MMTDLQELQNTLAVLTGQVKSLTKVVKIMMESQVAAQAALTKASKNNTVDVIRYYRPVTMNGTFDNLGGCAVLFRLDYTARTVTAVYAICSDQDNFSKDHARAVLRSRMGLEDDQIQFGLDDVEGEEQPLAERLLRAISLFQSAADFGRIHSSAVLPNGDTIASIRPSQNWQRIAKRLRSGEWC